jgi:ATP-dependent helicase HrpB
MQKVARYDSDRGIDSLETERVSADAADQRAGRAGRESPGRVVRLWHARDRLRPHREPDVLRVDLAGPALDILAWGGHPRTIDWFEPPRDDALERAVRLLERLELIKGGRLTSLGKQVARMPLHPRLGRMLVAAGGAREMARACAFLSERRLVPRHAASTTSDLLSAIDDWDAMPSPVRRAALYIAECGHPQSSMVRESNFRRATLAGYPDRVARRRAPGSASFLMASGAGATLSGDSGVRDAEFIVALDVGRTARRGGAGVPADPVIRIASRIEPEWLNATSSSVEHRFDSESGTVRAMRVDRYDALVLAEHPQSPDPEVRAQMLAEAWRTREPPAEDRQLLRRMAFAGLASNVDDLVRAAAESANSVEEIRLETSLPDGVKRKLDVQAPMTILVPSGRSHRLDYGDDGSVTASVKLQELFGLAETPRIGPRGVSVRLMLLAPNGRPVQVTQDLRSFWERTYPEVRKELRGRYPKHPWPEDPWSAPPTARTVTKSRR